MNLQEQIDVLLIEAAPLRLLPESEQAMLAAIVEKINALRSLQSVEVPVYAPAAVEPVGLAAEIIALAEAVPPPAPPEKRKPGRPRKAD